jgi:putative transcriptional regulator
MSAAAVQRLRKKLKVSQAVLAHYLNVSTKLVQAWEFGRRKPDGPALLLLRLAARRPELLISSHQVAAGE